MTRDKRPSAADVGTLWAVGRVKKRIFALTALDAIPLES